MIRDFNFRLENIFFSIPFRCIQENCDRRLTFPYTSFPRIREMYKKMNIFFISCGNTSAIGVCNNSSRSSSQQPQQTLGQKIIKYVGNVHDAEENGKMK